MSLRKKIIFSIILTILFFGSLAIGGVFFYTKNSLVEQENSVSMVYRLLGLTVLLIIMGTGLVVSILVKRFLKSLYLIQESALKISQGDLKIRINEKDLNSDFKELANAFNSMISNVLNSREEASRRVEEQVAEIKEKNQEIENQQKATINILEDVNNSQEELKLRYKELDVIKSLTQKLGLTLEEGAVMKNIALSLQELFPEAVISYAIAPILEGEKNSNSIHVYSLGRVGQRYLDMVKKQNISGFEMFPLYLKKQLFWKKWLKGNFSLEIDENSKGGDESKEPLSHINIPIVVPNAMAGLINISSDSATLFNDQENVDIIKTVIENAIQTIERLKILITSEHSRLQDLVESMRTAVVMFDANRRIVVVNSSAKRIFNVGGDNFSLQNILKFLQSGKISSGTAEKVSDLYESAVKKSKTQRIESLEVDRHFYEIIITPVNDLQNEVSGGAIILHDITHLKEIDRMKTEFVSVASHQLRTPLTAINWYVEMLQSGDAGALNRDQKTFLDEIYKGSTRMVKLVNELLNVSRLETGRLKVTPKPMYLDDLIVDVIHEAGAMAEKNSCKLIFEKPKKRLPKVELDETLMRQVVHNFITNAIRYSPPRGKIVISLSEKEDEYVVSVADQGIGIPKEAQGKIFQKFFRADNARKKEGEGSGIGLYIAKMIMEASMGKIWFESPTIRGKNKKDGGGGTTFFASIPKKGMLAHEGERELAI